MYVCIYIYIYIHICTGCAAIEGIFNTWPYTTWAAKSPACPALSSQGGYISAYHCTHDRTIQDRAPPLTPHLLYYTRLYYTMILLYYTML